MLWAASETRKRWKGSSYLAGSRGRSRWIEGRWGDPRPSTNHDSSLKLGCQWGCRSVWPRARFSLHFITEKPPLSSGKVEAHLSTPAQARQRSSFRQIARNDRGDRLDSEIQLFHLFFSSFFFFFTRNRLNSIVSNFSWTFHVLCSIN